MNSKKNNHRKCAHCGRRFRVDPRVSRHHRFCPRPVCAKISRVTAQRRWLKREKQREIESKADVYRMQDWREAHPGYWRRKAHVGRYVLHGELADVVREFALQDRHVCVCTIHGSKGLEFRAAHLVSTESIKKSSLNRSIAYTGITRAKTSMSIHHSAKLPLYLEGALAVTKPPVKPAKLHQLFGKKK